MSRAPRAGARLLDERKRKAQVALEGQPLKPSKRRKGAGGTTRATGGHLIVEGEDDDEQSDLVLMYNTVRGYVSTIKELWLYQTS